MRRLTWWTRTQKKKLERVIKKKIRSYIKEKGLLDSINVVMDPPFTEKIMVYLNTKKLKPLPIDSNDGTNDLVNHVQTC